MPNPANGLKKTSTTTDSSEPVRAHYAFPGGLAATCG